MDEQDRVTFEPLRLPPSAGPCMKCLTRPVRRAIHSMIVPVAYRGIYAPPQSGYTLRQIYEALGVRA